MSLNLDMRPSRAKHARGLEHLAAFQAELSDFRKNNPYVIRPGEVDPDTGWCVIYVRTKVGAELRLPVIVGDYIQNLRTSLDYIVTALVERSGAILTDRHAFPIHRTPEDYQADVFGGKGERTPRVRGCLEGVTYGLAEIESLQPYKMHADPDDSALWYVKTFSNADKHRYPLRTMIPILNDPMIEVRPGRVVDGIKKFKIDPIGNDEVEITRVRFAEPYPSTSEVSARMIYATAPHFAVPQFGKHPHGFQASEPGLRHIGEQIGSVLDLFEQL